MRLFYIIPFLLFAETACNMQKGTYNDISYERWAIRMADAAMERYDSLIIYNSPSKIKWQYDIALLGQAIDKLGYIDDKYSRYHEDFIDYFVKEDGSIAIYKQKDYNLDHVNPAKGLITLYKRKGKEKYLDAIKLIIKQFEDQPRTTAGGFWHKKIYPWQMWLDGVYMSSPFMAQYAREFNQPAWFDTLAHQITLIHAKTLDPSTGLLYHAWDESKSQQWANHETGQSREFWGRAMGWYMMALVDVLDHFPEAHPQRTDIGNILKATAEALLKVQDPKTGLWYQVLNKAGQPGNYLEASCSYMFIYAFAKGANKGYLPENYRSVAERSFRNSLDIFIKAGDDGMPVLTGICGAAGLGGNPYRDGSYEYYVNEKKADNDPKGVGPFILAALELNHH